jgi:O-antigen ligase/Tfp pilus assembly protein PilF
MSHNSPPSAQTTHSANHDDPADKSLSLWQSLMQRWSWGNLLIFIGIAFPLARIFIKPFATPGLLVPLLLVLVWFGWRATRPPSVIQTSLGIPLLLVAVGVALSCLNGFLLGIDVVGVMFHWVVVMGILLFLTMDLLANGWQPYIFPRALLLTISVGMVHGTWTLLAWWKKWLSVWQPGDILQPVHFLRDIISVHPNQAAMIVNIGLPLVIVAFWKTSRRWMQAVWSLWLVAAIVILFYTDARGGLLTMFVVIIGTLVPLLWSMFQAKQWGKFWKTVGVASCYGVLIALLLFANYRTMQAKAAIKAQFSSGTVTSGTTSSANVEKTIEAITNPTGRIALWESAFDLFKAHPFFGGGPNSFQFFYEEWKDPDRMLLPHAHNIYLAMLAELGAVASSALLFLLVMALWQWWKAWRSAPMQSERWLLLLACSGAWAGMLTHGLVDIPTRQIGGWPLLMAVVGLGASGTFTLAGRKAGDAKQPAKEPAEQRKKLFLPHPLHWGIVGGTLLAWAIAVPVFQQRHQSSEPPPSALEQTQAMVTQAFQQGDWELALHRCYEALETYPQDETLLQQRAVILAWQAFEDPQLLPNALDAHEQLLEQFPDEEIIMHNYAALLLQAGQQAQAQTLLQEMIERNPGDEDAHLLLAYRAEQMHNHEEALAHWEETLRFDRMLNTRFACQQSSICTTLKPTSPNAQTWLFVEQPDVAALKQIEAYAYAWQDVDMWAAGALAAERIGATHQQQRFALAAQEVANMKNRTANYSLAILLLRDATTRQDHAAIRQLLDKWFSSPFSATQVPQLSYLMLTIRHRFLAETALEAAKESGDADMLQRAQVYHTYVLENRAYPNISQGMPAMHTTRNQSGNGNALSR